MSESTSPVLALRYNILSAFEKANEGFQARLQAAVEQGRLNPEIELDERPGIPVAPKISRESRGSAAAIRLQVTYLEILWAFIYAWMILCEEGVQKPLLPLCLTMRISGSYRQQSALCPQGPAETLNTLYAY